MTGNTTTNVLDRVCILLMKEGDREHVYNLRYGDGRIRTYRPDMIDPRVGETVEVTDEESLRRALRSHELCRVPVRVAMKVFGWSKKRFAL